MVGVIEVICGPMFSGKTEELIRRVKRANIARQKTQIFKPSIDNRYHEKNIVSHDSSSLQAMPVHSSLEILKYIFDSTRVVAIDEIQFFDKSIIQVIKKLSKRGIRVICAGLDLDYTGNPFGPIPTILALADKVDKICAICTVCGDEATKTYRKDSSKASDKILIGESELYEARCGKHWEYDEEETKFFDSRVKQINLPFIGEENYETRDE